MTKDYADHHQHVSPSFWWPEVWRGHEEQGDVVGSDCLKFKGIVIHSKSAKRGEINMKVTKMYIVSKSINIIKNIMSIKFSNSHYQAVHDVHPAFQELFLIWRSGHPAHI